jgi:hypothetical protein
MATVNHFRYFTDLSPAGLGPGKSYWQGWGPSEEFESSTVIVKANPTTEVAGQTFQAMNVLSVGPIYVSVVPLVEAGEFIGWEAYVGVNITNAGKYAVKGMHIHLTTIKA